MAEAGIGGSDVLCLHRVDVTWPCSSPKEHAEKIIEIMELQLAEGATLLRRVVESRLNQRPRTFRDQPAVL